MTKTEFLKRCEVIYDRYSGEELSEIIRHIARAYDAIHRLEGGQIHYFTEFMEDESMRTDRFSNLKTLANDKLGYDGIYMLSILTHPCQKCAEDNDTWHTRPGFCNHK